MQKLSIFILILCLSSVASAYEKTELNLTSGADIVYTNYQSDGDTLVIWLPSERGLRPGFIESALSIADSGFDLWTLDLHESYLEPPGKSSMSKFSIDDIYEVMQIGKKQGFKHIILAAASRGAILALHAGRKWQQRSADKNFLGFIFLHPHLIQGSVVMGTDAKYLSIVRATNKPVFILQPEYSTKYLHRTDLISQFKSGGAKVRLKPLMGIVGGFYARDKKDLNAANLAMRNKMGSIFKEGFDFLIKSPQLKKPATFTKTATPKPKFRSAKLYPYKTQNTPELKLTDLYDKKFDLNDYKGKVVLVNFWASWCGPCVEEIPSLNSLAQKMQGKDFQILTVDIKETKTRINDFFTKFNLQHDFPVLIDKDGQVSKAWKVYAYPSNFLLDKTGNIRFGYKGALKWDDPAIIKTIESLL